MNSPDRDRGSKPRRDGPVGSGSGRGRPAAGGSSTPRGTAPRAGGSAGGRGSFKAGAGSPRDGASSRPSSGSPKFGGQGGSRPRSEGERGPATDRPKRPYTPRGDGEKRPYSARNDGEKRSFAPRGDGPKRPFTPRADGDKRPYSARNDGEKRQYTPRNDGEKRSYPPSTGGDKRRFTPRSGGEKRSYPPSTGGDKRPFTPRSDGEKRSYPPSTGGQKRSYPPSTGGDKRPYTPRSDGDKRSYPPSTGGQKRSYPPSTGGDKRSFSPRSGGTRAPAGRDARPERIGRDGRPDPGTPSAPRPPIDADVTGEELDKAVRRELSTLRAEAAESAAQHLVMTARLLDEDVEGAYAHAVAARHFGPRVAVIREALGVAAYHAEKYAEALSELRAARRISGNDEHLPVMADCERALDRPERALAIAAGPEVDKLDRAGRIEMRIIAAGARADLGQLEAAVVTLQCPELNETADKPWLARLRFAYAAALSLVGRDSESRRWYERAAEADPDGETGAAELLQELDGVVFLPTGFDDSDLDDELSATAGDPAAVAVVEEAEVPGDTAEDAEPAVADDAETETVAGPAATDEEADEPADVSPVTDPFGSGATPVADEEGTPEPERPAVDGTLSLFSALDAGGQG